MKRVLPTILLLLLLGAGSFTSSAQEHKAIVIYAQFPDLSFTASQEDFSSILQDLSTYYNYQFLGKKQFVFHSGPTVTLSNAYAYYGANTSDRRDALLHRLVHEACSLADEKVNFADYDNDNDGTVGDILIVVPGMSELDGAGENAFWPQYANLEDQNDVLYLDKKRITTFGLVCELNKDGQINGIGNLAHEFGHILGLKDLYDTDREDSGGLGKGLWKCTSLMDMGNLNNIGATPPNLNAVERHSLGNGSCTVLEQSGNYVLEPIDKAGEYFCIPGNDPKEFYLFEYRKAEGYDEFIGGSGMLIYHIDQREADAGWSTYYKETLSAAARWQKNQINCNPEHECAALIPADPEAEEVSRIFWPQESHDLFCSASSPAFTFWDGTGSRFALSNIASTANGVSFNLIEPILIKDEHIFQSSAIISWQTDSELEQLDSCRVVWYSSDEDRVSAKCEPIDAGIYSLSLEGLSPRTQYYYTIEAYVGPYLRYKLAGSFTTRNYRAGIFRFIFLGTAERNEDGSFVLGTRIPLVVYNSVGEEKVEWSFNGKAINAGNDGFWELKENGTLMAKVYEADGSTDIITKEITVR